MKSNGSVILFIGAPQTGKSTEIKAICKEISPTGKGVCAIDPYNEHTAELHIKEWEVMERIALNSNRHTFIFEEATHYFHSHKKTTGMKKLVTGAMGHFHHNIFFVFHDFGSVPTWIFPSINAVYYTKGLKKGDIPYPFNKITDLGERGRYSWYTREFLMS